MVEVTKVYVNVDDTAVNGLRTNLWPILAIINPTIHAIGAVDLGGRRAQDDSRVVAGAEGDEQMARKRDTRTHSRKRVCACGIHYRTTTTLTHLKKGIEE